MYTLLELATRYLILNRHLIDRHRLSPELNTHLDRHLNFYDLHTRGGCWHQLEYYDIKTEYCRQHINREYARRPLYRICQDVNRLQTGDPCPEWIDQPIADVPVSIDGHDHFTIRTFRQYPDAAYNGFYLDWLGFGIRIHFGGSGPPGQYQAIPMRLPGKAVLARSLP